MRIYISSSWKNREQVRYLATQLKKKGHFVFDFTDQNCRQEAICPPETYAEQFDPTIHDYGEYLDRPERRAAVEENRKQIDACDSVVLLLPCGVDATADWAYGVGSGKNSVVVGHPAAGERSPVHLWADVMLKDIDDAIDYFSC